MHVNNFPRVALDSGEATIRSRDLMIASQLSYRPPSHIKSRLNNWKLKMYKKNSRHCIDVIGPILLKM